MSKKHMGSGIDEFMKEERVFEEAQAQAVKEVVAWQLAEAMKKKKISKNRMARLLKTSRTQVDGFLTQRMTSRCQACSGPRRSSGAASQSSWCNPVGGIGRGKGVITLKPRARTQTLKITRRQFIGADRMDAREPNLWFDQISSRTMGN
jgi:antitoxin HicB